MVSTFVLLGYVVSNCRLRVIGYSICFSCTAATAAHHTPGIGQPYVLHKRTARTCDFMCVPRPTMMHRHGVSVPRSGGTCTARSSKCTACSHVKSRDVPLSCRCRGACGGGQRQLGRPADGASGGGGGSHRSCGRDTAGGACASTSRSRTALGGCHSRPLCVRRHGPFRRHVSLLEYRGAPSLSPGGPANPVRAPFALHLWLY